MQVNIAVPWMLWDCVLLKWLASCGLICELVDINQCSMNSNCIQIHTWNPNEAPCFDWSLGLVLGGWPSKIEVIWVPVPGIHTYIYINKYRIIQRLFGHNLTSEIIMFGMMIEALMKDIVLYHQISMFFWESHWHIPWGQALITVFLCRKKRMERCTWTSAVLSRFFRW